MRVESLSFADRELFPAAREGAARVCVVANANARRVTGKVLKSLTHVVSDEDLFLSKSELDARRIAQSVIDRRYDTVFCAGGDGTFTNFVNEILHQLEVGRGLPGQRAPRFGVLKLGTGNSMAELLNASAARGGGILDDVLRAQAGEVPSYRRLDLLRVGGRLAPFAGLGIDGRLLNDYDWVKTRLGKGLLKPVMTGASGYFASVALKTIPHCLTQSTWFECEVINGRSRAAFRLGPDGLPVGDPIGPGELLYRGRLMMAAGATIPYYGFGFKMFPFAGRRQGMMHLRLGALSTPRILANLPQLWKGKWFPEGIHDFHAQEATIHFGRPMPLQISGDAAGYRDQLTMSVGREQVELVDFTGAVN